MSNVQTIHLHGFMGQKYGKSVKLAGNNLFQVMSGLVSRFGPGFKEDIRTNDWHLCEGKVKAGNDIGEEEITKNLTKKTLHLLPAVKGESAALRIVLGVVLLVVAYLVPATAPWLVPMGASLILGGVVEILTKPKTGSPSQPQDQRGSSIYNGAVNVTTQGGPVPLIYGRVSRASSVVISTDFSSDEA
jgi:predicted phage tail protein